MPRPPKPEIEQLVSVSIRVPQAIYDKARERAKLRRTTLTALLLEGLRLCLDTPIDPREVPVSQGMTAIQELEQLIDARVYAILATERQREPAPQPGQPMAGLSSDERKTVIQEQEIEESTQDGNTVMPAQPRKRTGRQRSPIGQRILDLLRGHPQGLTAEQIRGHLSPERPIGDILSGMVRTGAVRMQGEGRRRRYVLSQQKD